MIPSMTAFVEALCQPEAHFKTLKGLEPVLRNGKPIVSRTALFAEAEVMLHGKRHLLFAPLNTHVVAHVERTLDMLASLRSDFLCPCHIHYDEMIVCDSLGEGHSHDIILQLLPEGEPFDIIHTSHTAEELYAMLRALEREMRRLHFSHNNLRARNLIIGTDGRLHPIRYHYATVGQGCCDDFEELLCEVKAASMSVGVVEDIVADYLDEAPYDEVLMPHEGLMRVCRNGLFGFIDSNMEPIVEVKYLWADDFYEGRAVVETEHGTGVIDKTGREVVPAEYDNVSYNVSQGEFVVRKAFEMKVFDYNGHIKRF